MQCPAIHVIDPNTITSPFPQQKTHPEADLTLPAKRVDSDRCFRQKNATRNVVTNDIHGPLGQTHVGRMTSAVNPNTNVFVPCHLLWVPIHGVSFAISCWTHFEQVL